MIDLKLSGGDVKVFVDIGAYWPKDSEGKEQSVNSVYKDLLRQNKEVDRRSLTAAKEGRLAKSDYTTLLNLRDFVAQQLGRPISVDEILRIEA